MQTEIEVKFIDIDIDDMRQRLEAAGAVCVQPMRLMRRQVFYLTDRAVDGFLRVRDEGHRTTMTYKRFEDNSLHGAKEAEVEVSSFESAVTILRETGLQPKSSQETRRETWQFAGVEVVIDEWPWLPPFVEIEGPDEASVKNIASRLGFDWGFAVYGGVTQAYRAFYKDLPADFTMNDLPEIRFDLPPPTRLVRTA